MSQCTSKWIRWHPHTTTIGKLCRDRENYEKNIGCKSHLRRTQCFAFTWTYQWWLWWVERWARRNEEPDQEWDDDEESGEDEQNEEEVSTQWEEERVLAQFVTSEFGLSSGVVYETSAAPQKGWSEDLDFGGYEQYPMSQIKQLTGTQEGVEEQEAMQDEEEEQASEPLIQYPRKRRNPKRCS